MIAIVTKNLILKERGMNDLFLNAFFYFLTPIKAKESSSSLS